MNCLTLCNTLSPDDHLIFTWLVSVKMNVLEEFLRKIMLKRQSCIVGKK